MDLEHVTPHQKRDEVRYDHAVLPNESTVREWCLQLATAARRKHSDLLADKWAGDVFSRLDDLSPNDGTWHKELERRLRQAIDRIMACEALP